MFWDLAVVGYRLELIFPTVSLQSNRSYTTVAYLRLSVEWCLSDSKIFRDEIGEFDEISNVPDP